MAWLKEVCQGWKKKVWQDSRAGGSTTETLCPGENRSNEHMRAGVMARTGSTGAFRRAWNG